MKGETLSFSSRTFLGYVQRGKSEGKIAQFEVQVVHRSEDAYTVLNWSYFCAAKAFVW